MILENTSKVHMKFENYQIQGKPKWEMTKTESVILQTSINFSCDYNNSKDCDVQYFLWGLMGPLCYVNTTDY